MPFGIVLQGSKNSCSACEKSEHLQTHVVALLLFSILTLSIFIAAFCALEVSSSVVLLHVKYLVAPFYTEPLNSSGPQSERPRQIIASSPS